MLYRGGSKGRIENDGLDIPANAQRTVNVCLDVVVQPRVEIEFVCLGHSDERANIVNGKVARFQMTIRIAERGSGTDVRRQAKVRRAKAT